MFPFLRKNKKARKQDSLPPWLIWLMVACVIYAIVMNNASEDNAVRSAVEKAKTDITQNPALDFAEYKNKIFPEYAAGLRINDIKEGSGLAAICGQKVAISYKSFLMQGNELSDQATAKKPLSFAIGDGKAMPAFDRGVIGMKSGGERNVIAPPLMSYGLEDYKREDVPKGASIRFEIKMLSITPPMPEVANTPYRVAELAAGAGAAVVCGEEAELLLTIWNMEGKTLYKAAPENPLRIIPGKSQTMLGLEQGIIGMRSGGKRLFIIPPDFQKTMNGNSPEISLPLPKDQVVIIEATKL